MMQLKWFFSIKFYSCILILSTLLGACEDDVLLEDLGTSAKKGGSYGKLIIDNDSVSIFYQYNTQNKEIY